MSLKTTLSIYYELCALKMSETFILTPNSCYRQALGDMYETEDPQESMKAFMKKLNDCSDLNSRYDRLAQDLGPVMVKSICEHHTKTNPVIARKVAAQCEDPAKIYGEVLLYLDTPFLLFFPRARVWSAENRYEF